MSDFENRWERRQQRWQDRKQNWENKCNRDNSNGHIWTGLIILIIGIGALLKAMAFPLPGWIFSWPMILIVIGFFSGLKCGFRGAAWFFMMLVGGAFLIERIIPGMQLQRYIWPVVLIIIGLVFVMRPRRRFSSSFDPDEKKTGQHSAFEEATVTEETINSSEDFLDSTSIFGGIKKNILTKNFKGGNVTNIMGGSELNFLQADIKGEAVLELTQLFGGTKIIVPSSWDVKSDIVAIFGGIEDKRMMENIVINPGKVLRLKGSSVFAGIEIRNF